MKSAYELAMERLNQASPTVKLTDTQRKALAELDSRYAAKIAEREIALKGQASEFAAKGEFDKATEAEGQLVAERKHLQAELEEKKEQVRRKQKPR